MLASKMLDKKLDKVDLNIEKTEKSIKENQVEQFKLNENLLEINELLESLETQKSTISESIAGSDAIISLNQKEIKSQTILIKSLKTAIQKEEIALSKYLKEIMNIDEELSKIQSSRDEIHQKLQDARINHLNLEGQRENVIFQESTAKDSIGEFVERGAEIKAEIKDIKEGEKNLNRLISSAVKKLSNINAMVAKQESVLNLKQETVNDSYVAIEEMQAQIRSEQKNRESLIEELKNCELKLADIDQRINFVSERIFDSYQINIPDEMIVDQSENELNISIE